jgi:3-(3-hydroxy-phenyl)propionate hydroxylase
MDSALSHRGPAEPTQVPRIGDRVPDAELHGPDGRPIRLHQLIDDNFLALYFTDVRRRPQIPEDVPGLRHVIISRWDAPLDGGLRGRSYFDVGDRFRSRVGCKPDTILLVRPDDHIAAVVVMQNASVGKIYQKAAHMN